MDKKLKFVGKIIKQGNRLFIPIPADLYEKGLELKDIQLKIEASPVFDED